MKLSLGKQRCLQQISNEQGIICTVALDHRDAYVAMLAEALGKEPTWGEVAEEKLCMTRAWVPHVTAVLLDPIYSAGPAIRQNAIPGSVGLMIAREQSGYAPSNQGRETVLLPDWSSSKIRRVGGAAVKLLLHYHPEAPNATRQEAVVCQVAEECARADVPFLLEPISYPLDPQMKKNDAAFARERPFLVIESARKLSRLGADVMKMEFPTDPDYEMDEAIMAVACRQITDAIEIPWVLLSAGVGFERFRQQVRIACTAGASGYVAGRAIWKEGLQLEEGEARERFYRGTAVERIHSLTTIANQYARPWWEAMPGESLTPLEAGWYVQVADL